MADLNHQFGSDLSFGVGGDVSLVAGSPQTVQRLLRRLLTSVQDYVWHPTYGVGLGGFIGQPTHADTISAIVTAQMLTEAGVAQSPPPQVSVSTDNAGSVYLSILYADSVTGTTQTLAFTVSK